MVAGFLAHDAPMIRYIAISVLATHWDLKRYVQTFRALGQSDPDEDVRQIAVSSVGWMLRGSRDRDASRFLLGIFRDPCQPAWIRETAYHGLVEIWQGWDAAHALFIRILRRKDVLRAEAEKVSASGEKPQIDWRPENAWEEFVDWDFVAQLEQAAKGEGSP